MIAAFLLLLQAAAGPSADDILRQALERERKQQIERARYLYRQEAEHRALGKNGEPGKLDFTREYEWIYLEGRPYRKLPRVDGKPLNGAQAKQEEERMKKTAGERRQQRIKGPVRSVEAGGAGLNDMLRLMENKLVRAEENGGRKAWVIESAPRRDAAAATDRDRKILCYRYTHWIDQQDRVIARQDFEEIADGVDVLPGAKSKAVFASENGSPWFPRLVEGRFQTKRGRWFERYTHSGFKKFSADSTIEFAPEEQ